MTLDVSNDTWLETWRPIGPKKSLNKPAAHEIVKAPIGPKKSLKKPAAVKAMKVMKAMKAKKATCRPCRGFATIGNA